MVCLTVCQECSALEKLYPLPDWSIRKTGVEKVKMEAAAPVFVFFC